MELKINQLPIGNIDQINLKNALSARARLMGLTDNNTETEVKAAEQKKTGAIKK